MVEACAAAASAAGLEPARVGHATDALLAEHGVEPGDDLPAWIPERVGFRGMVTASTSALEDAMGFQARPLQETAAWVLDWIRSGSAGQPPARLDADLERRILAAC
jgi:hypothetical protein